MIKTIFSQGLTKIHLTEASQSIIKVGVKVKFLTGWIPPRYIPNIFIDFIGNFVGRKELSKRLESRRFSNTHIEIISISFPEFLYWFLIIMNKIKIITYDKVSVIAWKCWGYYSNLYIKDADIFHVRSGAGQGKAIELAKKRGLKVIADHSIAHPTLIDNVLTKEYLKLGMKGPISSKSEFWKLVLKDCNDADIILVNSDFVKETFINEGYNNDKIKVIYLGVREDFFSLKLDYSKKSSKIKLLFTGSFEARKGAITIIDTLNVLDSKGIDFHLDIVGSFSKESEIIFQKLNNKNNVIIHGIKLQEELKSFLSNADIYIFPTFAEGSARSAMEAMAAGLPLITTYNCGVPINNMENGIIIPVDTPELLADKIEMLARDESLREKLGMNATNTIQKHYTWDNYGNNLLKFYTELLNKCN